MKKYIYTIVILCIIGLIYFLSNDILSIHTSKPEPVPISFKQKMINLEKELEQSGAYTKSDFELVLESKIEYQEDDMTLNSYPYISKGNYVNVKTRSARERVIRGIDADGDNIEYPEKYMAVARNYYMNKLIELERDPKIQQERQRRQQERQRRIDAHNLQLKLDHKAYLDSHPKAKALFESFPQFDQKAHNNKIIKNIEKYNKEKGK